MDTNAKGIIRFYFKTLLLAPRQSVDLLALDLLDGLRDAGYEIVKTQPEQFRIAHDGPHCRSEETFESVEKAEELLSWVLAGPRTPKSWLEKYPHPYIEASSDGWKTCERVEFEYRLTGTSWPETFTDLASARADLEYIQEQRSSSKDQYLFPLGIKRRRVLPWEQVEVD